MKSLKKLLSVLIVVAMIASFIPASIAASYIYEDQAIILNNLGLFKGSSSTTFEPDLGGPVTREQGVVQLVRTLGKEAEALAMSDADADKILIVFSDASSISGWAKKHIAWAVNNKVVAGYPNGKFGPQDALQGKAYAKMILSALGHTVDAAGYEAACFLMRDKGIIQWGDRGTLYHVLSFSEAQKFNERNLIRDELVALSYAALKLTYNNVSTVPADNRNKTAIQVLVENGVVSKDNAIAGFLFFRELRAAAEEAVAAYEAAPIGTLAEIAAAEALYAPAEEAVKEYEKGDIEGLSDIVNFNVKFNLNNAWVKADYDDFVSRLEAKAAAIEATKEGESDLQAAATEALEAYEEAPLTTLEEIEAAEELGLAAAAAIEACKDEDFKEAKTVLKEAKDTEVADAKALLMGEVEAAEEALDAYLAAPVSTPSEIDAALALYNIANAQINSVKDPVKKAELKALLDAVELAAAVKVSDTKTIEVNFNKVLTDEQKAAASFVVKFYNNNVAIKPATWNGNKAIIVRADEQALTAGNYTVEISGIAAISKVLVVEAERPAGMAIITSRLTNEAAPQDLVYEIYNQYGQKITGYTPVLNVYNMTDATRTVTVGYFNRLWCGNTHIGDVIKVTAYLPNYPEVTASADIAIVNLFVQSFQLGNPILPENANRLYEGLDNVKIQADIRSNYGDIITSFEGLIVTGTNVENIRTDNSKGEIIFNLVNAGPASITVINPASGMVVTRNFNVVALPAVNSIAIDPVDTNLRSNSADLKLTYKMFDQYGDVIDNDLAGVVFGSSNPNVAVLKASGNDILLDPAGVGTVTLTATVIATGKSSSITVTILEDARPVYIEVSGNPTLSLATSQVKNDLKIIVKDQDGKAINLPAGWKLTVAASGKISTTTGDITSTTNGITAAINATAAATAGTGSITVRMYDGDVQVGSPVVVNYTVAKRVYTSAGIDSGLYVNTSKAASHTFTFIAKDQTGAAINMTAETKVTWTVINGTGVAIKVGATTIAAGKSASFTTTIAIGSSSSDLTISEVPANSNGKIEVTATAGGNGAQATAYATQLSAGKNKTYTGSIVAIDKTNKYVVISTSIGYVYVGYSDANTFTVDGNTADATIFEDKVSIGDSLATDGLKINLINN